MSEKVKNKFNLNSLKGRIAEQLVQDLFQQCGYHVFNFGLERLNPALSKLLVNNKKKTSQSLRFMPDFVVQSSKNGDLFYMEVKFRANGEFGFDEHYADYPYQNAWFIIVSPQKIQCMHYKKLKEGYKVNASTKYSLLNVKSFHINEEMLTEYEEYCKVLFSAFSNETKK